MTFDEVRAVKLIFDPRPMPTYPHGYWYASNGFYDADGATPLDAVMTLAIELSAALSNVPESPAAATASGSTPPSGTTTPNETGDTT